MGGGVYGFVCGLCARLSLVANPLSEDKKQMHLNNTECVSMLTKSAKCFSRNTVILLSYPEPP